MAYTRPSDWFHIFNKYDPFGYIRSGAPEDEYFYAIGIVQDHIAECKSADELSNLVEFAFAEAETTVGVTAEIRKLFKDIANELWEFWKNGEKKQ